MKEKQPEFEFEWDKNEDEGMKKISKAMGTIW
jgi:hypothetical protein